MYGSAQSTYLMQLDAILARSVLLFGGYSKALLN